MGTNTWPARLRRRQGNSAPSGGWRQHVQERSTEQAQSGQSLGAGPAEAGLGRSQPWGRGLREAGLGRSQPWGRGLPSQGVA